MMMTQQKSTLSSGDCAVRGNMKGFVERGINKEGFYDSDEERDPPCTSDL